MAEREQFLHNHPGIFYLDPSCSSDLQSQLIQLGWMSAGERILEVRKAGEGNMNCTVRVRTGDRSFILKQARPWVEKYPAIPAPWDRALVEGAFYRMTGQQPALAAHMPKLLGLDPVAHLVCLEYMGEGGDYTSLYSGVPIPEADLRTLTGFLSSLHSAFRDSPEWPQFANRQMRLLNHQHIFLLPLEPDNGLDLDRLTPGLQAAARPLQTDEGLKKKVREAGYLYLSDGDCLLHGDYFPGSWLHTPNGPVVIDPEFCFFGPPEFDFGVMRAHLAMAGHAAPELPNGVDRTLADRFQGIEIIRRLIGVAQLPLRLDLAGKVRLLELARKLV